jgi:hypothetical protein
MYIFIALVVVTVTIAGFRGLDVALLDDVFKAVKISPYYRFEV